MARNGVRFNLHKLLVQRKDERIEGQHGCWLVKGLCQQPPIQPNPTQCNPPNPILSASSTISARFFLPLD